MDIVLLIKSGMGLIVILMLLVYLFFFSSKSSKKKDVVKKTYTKKSPLKVNYDLVHLISIIKNKKSTKEELQKALDLIIKYHGTIHKKLGVRVHPDFDNYMDILFTLCRHPNVTTKLIIAFDKELEDRNPEYKPEINNALSKGLNSRGM